MTAPPETTTAPVVSERMRELVAIAESAAQAEGELCGDSNKVRLAYYRKLADDARSHLLREIAALEADKLALDHLEGAIAGYMHDNETHETRWQINCDFGWQSGSLRDAIHAHRQEVSHAS